MRVLQAFMRAITRMNDWIGRCLCLLILFMFAFIVLEVFLRYVLQAPTVWSNELTQMLFGSYAVLSGGYLLANNGHVNVDLLHERLPLRVRAWVDVFTSSLFFLFTGAVLYFGASMAYESIARLEHSGSAWNPPVWPVKLMLPIAAVLLLLQGIVKLINDIMIALNIDGAGEDSTYHYDAEEQQQ